MKTIVATLALVILFTLPALAQSDRPTREDIAVEAVTEQAQEIVYDQRPRYLPYINRDGKLICNGTVFALDWRGVSKARKARAIAELNQAFREKGAK